MTTKNRYFKLQDDDFVRDSVTGECLMKKQSFKDSAYHELEKLEHAFQEFEVSMPHIENVDGIGKSVYASMYKQDIALFIKKMRANHNQMVKRVDGV